VRPRSSRTQKLAELAEALGLTFRGDPDAAVSRVSDLGTAGRDDLAALYDRKLIDEAMRSKAGVLVVPAALAARFGKRNLILAEAPKAALARAAALVHPVPPPASGVHETAVVGRDVVLGDDVAIGPNAVVGDRCVIGSGSVLGAGVVLLDDVRLGEGVELHPRVVLYPRTEVGAGCVLLAGAVIGAPGFGHARDERGRAIRVPHFGRVVLEECVEVGANTTIDRATFGATVIGARSRLDNLVQVGHNARVGADCMVAAQSGLSGSSELGDGVVVGGQSGLADHVAVGSGSAVAAKTSVFKNVEPGSMVAGTPAMPISRWRRMVAVQARLPEIWAAERRRRGPREEEDE